MMISPIAILAAAGSAEVTASDADGPFLIALAAQGIVILCVLSQLVPYLRGSRVIISKSAIWAGLFTTLVLVMYAATFRQWILFMAELTNLAVGLQLMLWHRKTGGVTAANRRTKLPVVSPERADPKSGIVPLPAPPSSKPQ